MSFTFGNTAIEASTGQLSGNILGNVSTPSAHGHIESITAYLAPTGTRNVVYGLYDAATDALLGTTTPISISTTDWHTGTFSTPIKVSSQKSYYILANTDGSFQCTIARASASSAGRFVAKAYDGTMPDPSGTANNNFRYSIYATGTDIIIASASNTAGTSGNTISVNLTNPGGDNQAIVVLAMAYDGTTIADTVVTGITYNGDVVGLRAGATQSTQNNARETVTMALRLAPDVGSNLTVTVTFAGNNESRSVHAMIVNNVRQTSQPEAEAKDVFENVTNPEIDITTLTDNALIIGGATFNDDNNPGVPSGQTELFNTGDGYDISSWNDLSTAGVKTHGYTNSSASNVAVVAIALAPFVELTSNIKKLSSIPQANLKKISGILSTNTKKVSGVSN